MKLEGHVLKKSGHAVEKVSGSNVVSYLCSTAVKWSGSQVVWLLYCQSCKQVLKQPNQVSRNSGFRY